MKAESISLHQRILGEVRDNILKGHWRPGQRIPIETEMAAGYGVSRMTVNKVLSQLSREGYLERRRKGGSFVASPRSQSAVMHIADLRQEVAQSGRQHAYAEIKHAVRQAGDADMAALHLRGQRPKILSLLGLHTADGLPYCLEDRIINLRAIPQAAEINFEAEPAGSWLLQAVPWSAAEHIIRAVAATASDAKYLSLAPRSPCLEIDRLTKRGAAPLTHVRLCYPGQQHQVTARFAPE